jgi:hypothetical protein
MRRRIRIATVGTIAVMAIALMSSSAGAATPTAPGNFTANANGGFINLSALKLINLGGGNSSATAQSPGSGGVGTDGATGTGLCLSIGSGPASNSNPCPATGPESTSDAINTTATASESSSSPGTDAPSANCLVPPLSLVLITLEAACGTATATEDAVGNPSASGEGNLASLTVGLGTAVPGLGSLLGNGTLCGSSSSPVASTTTAPTGLLSGLLGTVNGILGSANLPILSGSLSSGPLSSVCGIISGLTSELPIVGGLLSNATAATTLLSVTIGDSTSNISSAVATAPSGTAGAPGSVAVGDDLVTTTATTEGVDVDLLGMLDIKVLPNTASVTIDTTTGYVTATNAVTGLLSVTQGAGLPTIIAIPDLSSLLSNVLNALNIGGLINPQLTTLLASTSSGVGTTTGSATAADLELNVLDGLVILNLGDATASASSTAPVGSPLVTSPAVTPPIVTSAAVTPAAPAAVVPNVTTVHTGEFWSGSLPIFLLSGMGLAGIVMIARRRVFSVARSITPFARHSASGSVGGPPPGPASGTSSVPPPVSGPARRQPPL